MEVSPDNVVFYAWEMMVINATLIFTWLTMALLAVLSGWVTQRLAVRPQLPPWQDFLEMIVDGMYSQIGEITQQDPEHIFIFLVENRVNGDRRFSRLAIADDEFPLASPNGNQRVDHLQARLQRYRDRGAIEDGRSLPLHRAALRDI